MIRVDDVCKYFGGLKAVDHVSLEITEGSITGLIGPNGAGKTTLFNTIAGLYAPTSGRIFLDDKDITGLKSHQLFDQGLLRTFQIAREFTRLSVVENLMMVPAHQSGENLVNTWFRRRRIEQEERRIYQRAMEVIDFLNLGRVAGYGGADIRRGCSIEVNQAGIAVIVGPNGAGKSTAMKALLGMLGLIQGKVYFRGKDISALTPQDRIAE